MLEVWGRKNANQVIQVLWTLSELELNTKDTLLGLNLEILKLKNISLLTQTQKYLPLEIMALSVGVSCSHSISS
jgi:hypothetical protein